jgi:hypothetical protein
MAPFDPALIDDIRQAFGLDDPRAIEHVWYAMQALEATGVEVVIKSVEAPAQLTSADLTMQMLQDRYKK